MCKKFTSKIYQRAKETSIRKFAEGMFSHYQRCVFATIIFAKMPIIQGKKGVAKMVLQDKAFLERLRALKDKSGMTTKQIAEKCDIPESTVTRIFSGKTPNPTIITVMAMTKAMGGTAADIFDDNAQVNTIPAVPQSVLTEVEQKNLEIVELYERMLKTKDKYIRFLAGALIGIATLLVILLFLDLLVLDIGYFNR